MNSTLRFKLSTKSNDMQDTILMLNQLKNKQTDKNKIKIIDFAIGYFKQQNADVLYNSYVSCFTTKSDSRLLWDSYTMNSTGINNKNKKRYNGVCIAINSLKLNEYMRKTNKFNFLCKVFYLNKEYDYVIDFLLKNLVYDYNTNKNGEGLNFKSCGFDIKLEPQVYNAMKKFIDGVSKIAPYIKHNFWNEEDEIRATLYTQKNNNNNISETENEYIDIDINESIIEYIIKGPEFTQVDMNGLNELNCKLNLDKIKFENSNGTGVIRSR